VNLPPLVLVHSIFLSLVGLRMVFTNSAKSSPMAGITMLAIGIAYLSTSYMPIAQNQFLHASVPVRILLALVAGLKMVVDKNITQSARNEMLLVFLYDGIGGLVCGWQLENFSGKVPA
ncbi:hypothetical protein BT63DRAFT_362951, partial [Microthyrium microscopicum]